MSLVAVPLFVHILGTEAYGLVGLFASLQVVFTFLDLGLGSTVNRELARNTARGGDASPAKDLVRTFEAIYWPVGIAIGAAILGAAGWISTNLVNAQQLSHAEIRTAVAIMAFSIAVRWPVALYTGVLQGLQRQLLQNAVFAGALTLRTLGALAVIAWVSPTITAFLLAQAAAGVAEVAAFCALCWKALGRGAASRPRPRAELLKRVWRFALGFNAVGVLGVALSNVDRIVISRCLPLPHVGYYAIASTAAGVVPLISYAVMTAVFPRFSAHAAAGDKDALSRNYHRSIQAIAFPAVGVTLALAFYAGDILLWWTRSAEIAQEARSSLAILAVANLFAALLNTPFMMLMAAGDAKVPLTINIANALVFIPALLFLVPAGGIAAAAAVWLAQNVIVLAVYSQRVGKAFLDERPGRSLARDILVYAACGTAWVGGARLLAPPGTGTAATALSIVAAGLGYTITVLLLSRTVSVFPHGLLKVLAGETGQRP